jgi:hypothetical protein
MMKALVVGAAALVLSAGAASAQVVYLGYGYAPMDMATARMVTATELRPHSTITQVQHTATELRPRSTITRLQAMGYRPRQERPLLS